MKRPSIFLLLSLFVLCMFNTSCSLVDGFFSEEPVANTETKNVFNEQPVRFAYPSNWNLEHNEIKSDELASYTVKSPGKCTLKVILHSVQDSSDSAADTLAKTRNPRPQFTSTKGDRFTRWGRFSGKGRVLRGSIFGKDTTLRIFAHTRERKSFMIFEECWDSHRMKALPGFGLIERSFAIEPIDLSKMRALNPRKTVRPTLQPKAPKVRP